MKFSKTLEEEAIPEWTVHYFDYKKAKKKLKAVGKAVSKVSTNPRSSGNASRPAGSSLRDGPVLSLLRRRQTTVGVDASSQHVQSHLATGVNFTPTIASIEHKSNENRATTAVPITEQSALRNSQSWMQNRDLPQQQKRMRSYGSIIGSPPEGENSWGDDDDDGENKDRASSLRLPNPAIPESTDPEYDRPVSPSGKPPEATEQLATASTTSSATQLGAKGRSNSTPGGVRPLARRLLSAAGNFSPNHPRRVGTAGTPNAQDDIALEAYRDYDFRKAEFFQFLDAELFKINTFYATKEATATEHLAQLRQQLHIYRARRMMEVDHQRKGRPNTDSDDAKQSPSDGHLLHLPFMHRTPHAPSRDRATGSLSFAHEAMDRVRTGHVGKTSKAMKQLGTPPGLTGNWQPGLDQRDYAVQSNVSHAAAKRKLKLALAEFFRELEFLKAYAGTNREAFRKIIKKYDKTAMTSHKGVYMYEKVNTAHFTNSSLVDDLMADSESLYARYFERGNTKVAARKLRAKLAKKFDPVGPAARASAYLSVGLVFGLYGIVDGVRSLYSASKGTATVFLLQLYAGYFLMVLLGALFCLDAALFTRYRVNYQNIFEIPAKNRLNWLQALEVPAFFFLLMAGAMWLNFSVQAGGLEFFDWWFVTLISLSGLIFIFPFKFLYWRTRLWILVTVQRLALSGFYEVQFRDFFLGDMFCSLTYSLGNIELFFCVYSKDFTGNLAQCTSSHSRLLGFFSALPGVWRAIQCIRRYANTGAVFPHLFNCAKYMCTILQYVSLSIYRIDKSHGSQAFFIVAATINGCYCSYWDLQYDWSLLDRKAPNPWLRKYIAYKKLKLMYYVAIFLDPILRFNWVFYVIFADDLQHASLVSFLVALSEVFRRALWTLFRVENEHATNITKEKASLDYELPYEVAEPRPDSMRTGGTGEPSVRTGDTAELEDGQAKADVDTDSPIARALYRVGTVVRTGHQQDYVKKKDDDAAPADSDDDSDDE